MRDSRIPIRSWRVVEAQPHGLSMWFDPRTERPRLYALGPSEPSGSRGVGDPGEEDDQYDIYEPDSSETLTSIREVDPSF